VRYTHNTAPQGNLRSHDHGWAWEGNAASRQACLPPVQIRPLVPDVPGQVTHDFVAAHRTANQLDVVQVQGLEERGQVIGRRVVIVAEAWRIRAAVPAPVVADAAQASCAAARCA